MRRAWPAVLALACLAVPSAAAHALLASSDPASGAAVAQPPAVVRLVFTEAVEPAGTSAHVVDGNGTAMDTGQSFPARDRLDVAVRSLANGTYTVQWTSLSVDGHAARGSFSFSVGAGAPTEGGKLLLRQHGAASQFFLLVGLTASLGMVAFAGLVLPPGTAWPDRRLVLATAALMATVAFFGAMLVLGDGVDGSGLGTAFLTRTRAGLLWTLRAAALAVAVPLLWRHGRKAAAAPLAALPLALLVGCVLATSATSHAAALPSNAPVNEALDALHLLAASLWAGGVLGLLVWLPGQPVEAVARAVGRFSPLAVGSVAVLLAAGTARGLVQLHRLEALWTTRYGGLLLAKVALAIILVGLGAVQRYRIHPRLRAGGGVQTFQRTLAFEALLMAAVLAFTGLLTSASPPAP